MKKKRDIKISKYTTFLVGTWVGCLLLLGAGYLFFHLPQKEIMGQVRRQFTESNERREIAEMASQDGVRQKIQQRYEEVDHKINCFSVSKDNMTSLVFEIGKMAGELGLSEFSSKNLNSRNVSTVKKSQIVTEQWLAIEFNASFEQFAQFVNRLEKSTPVVFVEKMMIRRADKGQKKHEVKMELSFLATNEKKPHSVAMSNPR